MTTIGQQFVGPPIGSLLFAVAVTLPFRINLLSFAASAGLIFSLPRVPGPSGQAPSQSIRQAVKVGFNGW